MNLLQKLQNAGVKVYNSEPFWENPVKLDTVTLGDSCVLCDSKFGKKQLAIELEGQRVYVPLKFGAKEDKQEYNLTQYTAARDWEEYSIKAGDLHVFAE